MKKYYIHTFGCQMNFHDSEKMESALKKNGYKQSQNINEADVIIFNTCTIREKAYQKALSAIGRLKKNKQKIIAMCGCGAQQSGDALLKKFSQLDIVCGPDQIQNLPKLINEAFIGKRSSKTDFIDEHPYPFQNDIVFNEQGIGFITVMKGCNCKCSYCIVPSVRGKEVCRSPEDIINEIKSRIELGAKEITLLGQNVNRYKYQNINFTELLKKVLDETDANWIRFISPHPAFFDDELIKLMNNKRICPHVHLPLQAGSNDVLKKMFRGYTKEKYLDIVNKLRNARPDISISTDIIVGFCTETDVDFEDTLNIVSKVEFDSIFAFCYSVRPGTKSAEWSDDVQKNIKEERLQKLFSIQEKISKKKNSNKIGEKTDALVLSKDPLGRGMLKARTRDNKTVIFSGDENLIGNIVTLKINNFGTNSLIGELL